MLGFLLAKPTQFDAPFFKWIQACRPGFPFRVFYWRPVQTAAATDGETGASLTWGFNLLEGYGWEEVNPLKPDEFGKILQGWGIRYLVCNGWKQGFAPLVAGASKWGIPLGLRIDSVLWGKSPVEMWARRIWLGRAYRRFSHFFSSGTVGDEYLHAMGYGREKIRRWPYCIDMGLFAPGPENIARATALKAKYGLDDRPIVLAVCKWVERENPVELMRAFVQLNRCDIQLVMIGDGPWSGPLNKLKKESPQLPILFPGYVPYLELPAWYAMAKLFVHTASCEVWGVSIQEAMAAGCAVIGSTRVGSGYDLIREGQNGFQYPLGNVSALAHCIEKALALPAETIDSANNVVLKDWDYPAIYRHFEGLW